RDAIRGDACRAPRDSVAITCAATLCLKLCVVVCGDANEHSDWRSGPALRCLAGVFKCLPGQLEKQSVLRIDKNGLTGRNAEEIGVEQVDALEESSTARKIEVSARCIPSRLRRRGDSIGAVAQHSPKGFGVIRARETATDSSNGDRFGPTIADDGRL